MNKSDLIEQGRKEVLQNISSKLKDCFNILIEPSNQDLFIKNLISLLIEKPCLLKFHKIVCSLTQVSDFHSDLTNFISQFQSGLTSEKKLKLGKVYFDLKLTQSEPLPSKPQIADQIFNSFQEPPSKENPGPSSFFPLTETLKDLKIDSFLIKQKTKLKNLEFSDFFQITQKPKNEKFSTFDIILLKFQKKQETILQEIEWKKQDLLNERARIEFTKKKIKKKKEKLRDLAEKVKKEKLENFKEREEIESFKSSRSLTSTNPSSENSSLVSDSSPRVSKFFHPSQPEARLQARPFFPSIIPDLQKSLEKILTLLDQDNSSQIRSQLFKIRSKLALFSSQSIHSRLSLKKVQDSNLNPFSSRKEIQKNLEEADWSKSLPTGLPSDPASS